MKNKLNATGKGEKHISFKKHSKMLIKDLPISEIFIIDDVNNKPFETDIVAEYLDKYVGPDPNPEERVFSIYRKNENICLVGCVSGFTSSKWENDFPISQYLNLKQEKILKECRLHENNVSVDTRNYSVNYIIEVDGTTIGNVIDTVHNIDIDISREVIETIRHTPDLLRLSLGIITPAEFGKIFSSSRIKV